MALTRINTKTQSTKSLVPGSILTTDSSNEPVYLSPGAEGQILGISSGVPTYIPAPSGGADSSFREEFAPADGANTITLSHTPTNPLTMQVERNGLGQREGVGKDYILSGSVLTFGQHFNNSIIVVTYKY